MKYTAAHWGAYQFEDGAEELQPLAGDPNPSRIGKGWVSAARDAATRVLKPAVRKGWLEGDNGAARCNDSYVEVSWDRALDLAAEEVMRVRAEHGNSAIFGGSYGWSSSGRFHHAQSQMRRFLSLGGGFTSSRETYSHAAAEVLFPHVLGMSNTKLQDQITSQPLVTEHCELMLAFGGISARTAQIMSAGTSYHEVGPWIDALAAKGVRVITIAPEKGEARGEWWAIRPGTDTALILALIHEIVAAGQHDQTFLDTYTSGWEDFRKYVMGEADGTAKTADWAAPICDLPAGDISALAADLHRSKSMISMSWSMQRTDHGEQPIWTGLALACVLGQIGQPGTGFAFGYGSTSPVGRAARLVPWPSFPVPKNPVSDYIPVARITDLLNTPGGAYHYNLQERTYPDTRLVWWCGGNPFHHHQDLRKLEAAWCKPETVIVNEHSWTATARRADIVLPATTPLERDDMMLNRRDPTLLYMSALMAPMGAARDDFEIFADLSERCGFGDAFTEGRDAAAWQEHMWGQCQAVAGAHGFQLPEWAEFKAQGRFDIPDPLERRIALEGFVADPAGNPLGTESGKITISNQAIGAGGLMDCLGHPVWIPPTEGGPLAEGEFHLISGQPDTRLHGQNDMGSESLATKIQGREVATLHPEAAARIGVAAGDIIRLYNERGACLAGVAISDALRADCISLPTGAWYDPQIVDGAYLEVHGNPNALTLDKGCSDLSQGNAAHTCAVHVEKWTKPLPALTVTAPPPFVTET